MHYEGTVIAYLIIEFLIKAEHECLTPHSDTQNILHLIDKFL